MKTVGGVTGLSAAEAAAEPGPAAASASGFGVPKSAAEEQSSDDKWTGEGGVGPPAVPGDGAARCCAIISSNLLSRAALVLGVSGLGEDPSGATETGVLTPVADAGEALRGVTLRFGGVTGTAPGGAL